jgi:hypothetical protein
MRDPICLHARLAVTDGLTHQPIHPLNPATADTAVAARETCALRDAVFPPERRPDMLPASHESLTRGHRVREFVCTYRTLRDDQGQRFGYRRRLSAIPVAADAGAASPARP